MHNDGVSASTRITLTRKDLESWKRRSAVTLHFSVMVFSKSIRTHHTVLTVNYKRLKSTRFDHTTGKNNSMSVWGYKTLTRTYMDELLATPYNVFKIQIFAGQDGASATTHNIRLFKSGAIATI